MLLLKHDALLPGKQGELMIREWRHETTSVSFLKISQRPMGLRRLTCKAQARADA
jgi:hypothetical protein